MDGMGSNVVVAVHVTGCSTNYKTYCGFVFLANQVAKLVTSNAGCGTGNAFVGCNK